MAKFGRNQRCPCGSARKYKHCHGNPLHPKPLPPTQEAMKKIHKTIQRHEAEELVRVQQQGEGRPIISTIFKDHRFVAVGDKLHHSKKWKFFSDFLSDYLKTVMESEWGNSELKKDWDERHPILRWYHDYCTAQQASEKQPDGTYSAIPTGVVNCYLGLGYGLYLLHHNVELQSRLIERLKDRGNFQGAYYEIIVASCLIRAGFELTLEDETDEKEKHCEFSAVSKETGKKYWVEAKMKSVVGMLGKTKMDGSSRTSKPDSQVTTHLREALRKPANDERLIFIDVNTPGPSREDIENKRAPRWVETSARRIESREREQIEGDRAYVFITNFPFHWHLEEESPPKMALAYGLGIRDFSKPGEYRLSDMWKNKQKHIDGYNIMESLRKYPQIPMTFGGELPLESEDIGNRVQVGEKYFFEDFGDKGVVAEVTSATISASEKKMYITIYTEDRESHIITREVTDRELEVYRAHTDGFFGIVQRQGEQIEDPYKLLEWMMEGYKDTPRERLLEMCRERPDLRQLEKLDDTEIRLALCESWTAALVQSANLTEVESLGKGQK